VVWVTDFPPATRSLDASSRRHGAHEAAYTAYRRVHHVVELMRGGLPTFLEQRPDISSSHPKIQKNAFELEVNRCFRQAAKACERAAEANGRSPAFALFEQRDDVSERLQWLDANPSDENAHLRSWLGRRWTRAVRFRNPWEEELFDIVVLKIRGSASASSTAVDVVEWMTDIPAGTLRRYAIRRSFDTGGS